MIVLEIFIAVAAIYLIYLIFCRQRRRLYKLADLIPGENGYPLLGNIPNYFGLDTKEYVVEILSNIKQGFPVTKGWFGPKLVIFTEDPDCIHAIHHSEHALKKPLFFYDGLNIKHGLLASNGEEYDRHRKVITRAFAPAMLKQSIPTYNEKCRKCIGILKSKVGTGDFDIFKYVGTCTIEAFFAKNYNYDRNFYGTEFVDKFIEAKQLVTERIYKPWNSIKPFCYFTTIGRKWEEFNGIIDRFIDDVLRHNQSEDVKSEQKSGDTVINLLTNPKYAFTDAEIRDELRTFIYVTFDTTGATTGSVLLLLAMNKSIQERVIQEIDEVVASTDSIDMEDLNKLSYLELVIKETMRLYPAGGIIGRETTGEFDLNGFTIPEKTTVITSIYGMHRSEQFWGSDAHLFKPERFAPENFEKIHSYAFLPFAGGKRTCSGSKFSMVFMKVFLVHFFKSFTVDTKLKYEELEVEMMPTVSIADGYVISIENRVK